MVGPSVIGNAQAGCIQALPVQIADYFVQHRIGFPEQVDNRHLAITIADQALLQHLGHLMMTFSVIGR
ncbi:hypothetical protein D1872_279400 [compost metagenome]